MTSTLISVALNAGSLAFGVASWVFAIFAITAPKAFMAHRKTVYSFSCCIIALLLQLYEISARVHIGDYAAIEDTIRAILFASVVLICINVVLNVAALLKAKKK